MSALAYAGWLFALCAACGFSAARLRLTRQSELVADAGPRAARAAVRGAAGAARDRRCRARSTSSSGARRWRSTISWPPAAAAARAGAPSSWTSGRCSTTARRPGRRWPRRSESSLSVEPLRGRALVRADPLRLAQACGNLVANALEHGGSPVRVRGRVVAGRVRIEVSDAGPGLPEPVSRLIARRRRGAPRGRGLTIAARIARDHGGRLSSAPSSRGACLVIELPSADAAPAIEPFPPSRFDPSWRPDTRPIPLDPSWRPRDPTSAVRPAPAAPPTGSRSGPAASSPRRPMTRRRRGALLIGLALALGGLAASDVGRREAAVRAQLAPLVDVVVAGRDLPPRRRLATSDLALRRIPARYAPVGAASVPEEVVGRRLTSAAPRGRVPRRGPARGRVGARPGEDAPGGARGRGRGRRLARARRRGRAGRRRRGARARRRAARAVGRAGARGPPARRGGRRRRGRARRRHAAGDGDAGARARRRSRRARARSGCSPGPPEGRVPGARRLWAA